MSKFHKMFKNVKIIELHCYMESPGKMPGIGLVICEKACTFLDFR